MVHIIICTLGNSLTEKFLIVLSTDHMALISKYKMDKFVIKKATPSPSSETLDDTATTKRPCPSANEIQKKKSYKQNLRYNPEWKTRWTWMVYTTEQEGGMLCTFCKKYGKPPVQARGAWVSRPVSNWVKATELLDKHQKSEWHKASVEAQALADSARIHGSVVEQMVIASNEEKRKNHEVMKQLIRSVYFLVRNRIPHTTTFQDLVTLQIDNGNQQLRVHQNTSPANATYLSTATTSELLNSISYCIENQLLDRLNSSQYFFLMGDEVLTWLRRRSCQYVRGGWRKAKL